MDAAWLAADPVDDPATIVAYLAAGLEIDHQPLFELAEQALGRAVQGLLAAVAARETQLCLILDDVDRWGAEIRDSVLQPLFRLAPRNLSIICSLRIADETLAGHADLALGATDLRFTLEEVKDLCGRSISMRRARALLRQSQGWPRLVNILTDQYRCSITPAMADALIGAFARKHLAPLLTQDDFGLLTKLTALRAFDLPLARRLGGAASLSRLTDLTLVAANQVRDGLGLSVNPLLARLAPDPMPGEAVAIRRTAFADLFDRADYVAAMRFAVEIGDDACIASIIDAWDPLEIFLGQGISELEKIIQLIPPDVVERDIRIASACAISLLKNGRINDANLLVEKVAGKAVSTKPSLVAEENAHFFVAKALLNIHQGKLASPSDLVLMEQLAERWSARLPEARSWIAAVRTQAAQSMGRIAEARAAALDGIASCRDFEGRYATFYHHCDLAVIEAIAGRRSLAREIFNRIARDYRDVLRADVRLRVVLDTFLIELDHEEDPRKFDAMGRLRTICRELPSLEGWPDLFAAAFRTYSEKLMLAGDAQGAVALLDAGLLYARREGVEPLVFVIEHQRAIIHMLGGDTAAARDAISAYASLESNDILVRSWREVEACLEARALLDQAIPDQGTALLLAAGMSHAVINDLGRCKARYASLADPANRGMRAEMAAAIGRSDGCHAAAADHLLTPRAREVLTALSKGMTDKEIGLALGLSPHGVRYHLKRAYAQMNVGSREEACARLHEAGLAIMPPY
ncbi:helix-turn-helix transcriptional regulator [Sphingomonas colocasiae]|uniref:LuxR C-terminal-related transcriptional regulator n=1 Tax=Sphingomonas colocasiae TaxID=1848973 RepID=A0ABS7PQ43_9SPHN|nr:LuxR C-terminal-related transcriptional regulator [Sphingomonas colocasiae]MBY8823460.1 LuxR C-terminal-related transcriptional regulator [Sphingomonas colocasiae]